MKHSKKAVILWGAMAVLFYVLYSVALGSMNPRAFGAVLWPVFLYVEAAICAMWGMVLVFLLLDERSTGREKEFSYLDHQRKITKEQLDLSTDFANCMQAAVSRGFSMQIVVIIDGQVSKSALVTRRNKDGVAEFLANWACSMKLVYQDKLERLYDPHWGTGSPVGASEPQA